MILLGGRNKIDGGMRDIESRPIGLGVFGIGLDIRQRDSLHGVSVGAIVSGGGGGGRRRRGCRRGSGGGRFGGIHGHSTEHSSGQEN